MLPLVFVAGLLLGSESISLQDIKQDKFVRIILFDIRLPRTLLALLCGSLLAGSGAVFHPKLVVRRFFMFHPWAPRIIRLAARHVYWHRATSFVRNGKNFTQLTNRIVVGIETDHVVTQLSIVFFVFNGAQAVHFILN